jgi:hypothetical protein
LLGQERQWFIKGQREGKYKAQIIDLWTARQKEGKETVSGTRRQKEREKELTADIRERRTKNRKRNKEI